jgi:hypothetical protein
MKHVFAAVLAMACVVGSTPGFAYGGPVLHVARGAGFANGSGRGGFEARNPGGRIFRGTNDGRVLAYGGQHELSPHSAHQ